MSPRHLAKLAWECLAQCKLYFRLARPKSEQASVLYCGLVPKVGAKASGGAVKLSYLAARFPESGFHGNILYLVSSALPRATLAWARVAKSKGIAIVLNQNGVAYPAWAGKSELERFNRQNAEIAGLADHIIFQSEFCRKSFARWVGSRPRAESVLHNPVDTSLFLPAPGVEKKTDILLMGSASQPERIHEALKAVALGHKRGLPWRACIAGKMHWQGAEEDFSGWLRAYGLEKFVSWKGAYTQAEAVALYGDARVLLHLQDKDASPTVPLEAMACGIPVVAPRSGGLPELVTEETGRLLAVEESWEKFVYPATEEIFEALRDCMAREGAMAAACRARVVEKFSLGLFIPRHEQLFRELLKQKHSEPTA